MWERVKNRGGEVDWSIDTPEWGGGTLETPREGETRKGTNQRATE